jgi:hypothetical protein
MAEEVIAMAIEKEAKKLALGIPLTGKRHLFLNLKKYTRNSNDRRLFSLILAVSAIYFPI